MAATSLRPGEGHAGRAVLEQRRVAVPDLARAVELSHRDVSLADESFVAYQAIPLVAKGQARGSWKSSAARRWTPTATGPPS